MANRPSAAPTGQSYGLVNLRYLEKSPIIAQGQVTGRRYEFSAARPVQAVDARDVPAFLRTRFFQPAG